MNKQVCVPPVLHICPNIQERIKGGGYTNIYLCMMTSNCSGGKSFSKLKNTEYHGSTAIEPVLINEN